MPRCPWATTENMIHYHDTVWGVPEFDDQRLFRKLMLDINQAGLSWQTILNKSAGFDAAYDGFDIDTVAHYTEAKVAELLENPAIIRNRLKIRAAIQNAQCVQTIQAEWGTFGAYLWHFTEGKPVIGHYQTQEEVPTSTELSDRITKDLKKRGFKFVGTTIIYAFLEAVGIVNDHLLTCPQFQTVQEVVYD